MDKQFICGENKYTFRHRTIGLPVSFLNLPKTIQIEGHTLLLKSSFHVSLVCIGKIIEKYNISIPDFENSVINDFCQFIQNNDISLLRCRNEFKFVSHNERRAVIVMCDISYLDKFFDHINKKYNLNIEYPPTHATLYTLQPDMGIFITDKADISQFTKIIPNPVEVSL